MPTGTSGRAATSDPRPRPRDRKQQILAAARDLFVRRGYPNVTMAQIAEVVGITAGALYRHFGNKSVLLEEVIAESFAWMDQPITSADYPDVIDDLIVRLADKPYLSDLWTHEIRYLPGDALGDLRRRMLAWNDSLAPALHRERPDLDQGQQELLAWAIQSLLSCLGRQAMHSPLPVRLPVVRAALGVIITADLAPTAALVAAQRPRLVAESTRERLLGAAYRQFGERGYPDTSMASLGAAAHVTGPNLYGYFASKAELLRAVLDRSTHALWLGLDQALATSTSPADALHKLVTSYVTLSRSWSTTLEDPTGEYDIEESAKASQREYLAEWVSLLHQACPSLDRRAARVRVQLTFFLVADLHRNPRVSRAASFVTNLETLALAILLEGARDL